MRTGATIDGPILNVGDEVKHNIDFQTKQLFLHETHGYSIRGVENDLVTLVDPHDTEEEICLHKDIVKEIVKAGMGDIYYTELE